jgi:fructose-1,6-bisphosphatase/inositol monophosphatase family enzyme
MVEEIKILAAKVVDKIYRKVRRVAKSDFSSFKKNVGIGADGTPTKFIDQLAEDVALDAINKSKTKVNVLSEEAGFIDNGGEYVFVLDPVDGTRNASRGIPFYSVSLAVGKKDLSDVWYGIIKNIPTGDLFVVEKDHGAFMNKKQVAAPELPDKQILSCLTLGNNYDKKSLGLAKQDKVRSMGCASLEMCLVATGALDFYIVGREYMRVTDIAASTLFVREAGGLVTDILGRKLDMSLSLDERTSVIAACNKELIEKLTVLG